MVREYINPYGHILATLWEGSSIESVDGRECWVWHGYRDEHDYGHIYFNGRKWLVHRLGFFLLKYPLDGDWQVDHLCFNRPCWNPSHLRQLPLQENCVLHKFSQTNRYPRTRPFCRRGHALTDDNAIVRKTGKRQCRMCVEAIEKERRERKRAARLVGDRKQYVYQKSKMKAVIENLVKYEINLPNSTEETMQ